MSEANISDIAVKKQCTSCNVKLSERQYYQDAIVVCKSCWSSYLSPQAEPDKARRLPMSA